MINISERSARLLVQMLNQIPITGVQAKMQIAVVQQELENGLLVLRQNNEKGTETYSDSPS